MEISSRDLERPINWETYILTFKSGDLHPIEKVPMNDKAVRIVAPNVEKAKEIVRSRFGKSFYELHIEKKMNKKFPVFNIFETLLYKE